MLNSCGGTSHPRLQATYHRLFLQTPRLTINQHSRLSDSIADIQSKYKDAILILAGDFNLAGIDWPNRSVKPYAHDGTKCSSLLDVCNEFFLDQLVTEPTEYLGAKNILDFVNNPPKLHRNM